jgi:hypothetical protein
MTDPSIAPYRLMTRPCLVDIGRFRWDIYNNDSLFQTSAESFDTQEEARASGAIELERLPIPLPSP